MLQLVGDGCEKTVELKWNSGVVGVVVSEFLQFRSHLLALTAVTGLVNKRCLSVPPRMTIHRSTAQLLVKLKRQVRCNLESKQLPKHKHVLKKTNSMASWFLETSLQISELSPFEVQS